MNKTSRSGGDMPVEEFRRVGHEAIEWVANYLEDPGKHPVLANCRPGELQSRLPSRGPRTGESMDVILHDFEESILPAVTHWNHPRFHGYFSISSSGPGILGELLTATLDVNAMLWKSCPAATELEQTTVAWMLDWLDLPAEWFGMILDSASSGVLHALVAARQRTEPQSRSAGASGPLVAYVSEHTHSSVEKAAIAVGLGQSNVRHIAVDARFRMRTDELARAIRSDLSQDLRPFFAVATVGTTSTTAVDPVEEIGSLCREYGLWLHVDGAYGGSFGIVPECRHILNGVDQADSFVVNPHKMMMVPLDCSLLYTCHPGQLRSAFALGAEYLKTDAANAVDYMDYGLVLGRRFRALKLWFVMRYFGLDGLVALLRDVLRMAAWLGEQIAADARFELVERGAMGLICFRLHRGDAATKQLMSRINGSGRFFVSHTVVGGRFTIRVAIGNIRTQQSNVEELWAFMAEAAGSCRQSRASMRH
jgi:aromatic-L-amino-acid/L-tryptophan decarboxylase